jgi:PAS domain S-box-containing protein
MKNSVRQLSLSLVSLFWSLPLLAAELATDPMAEAPPFKNPDGSTKWQHIANFSASVFIILLVIISLLLWWANRRAGRANRELIEIKNNLEERVAQRTESLAQTADHLKRREAYISSVLDSMPAMLIGLNQQLEIIQWNRMAETITGRPIASILGQKLWQAYPAITITQEQLEQVLRSGETLSFKHSQRGQYYFDITAYALSDKADGGIVILINDVTKQLNAENKLAERDKLSAMGELTSARAYDLNLPLQSILSSLHNAQQQLQARELDVTKDEILAALQTFQASGQQAAAITQNLMQLAESQREQQQTCRLDEIMERSIAQAQQLFADATGLSFSDITIKRHYALQLPAVPCRAAEMQQVFVRLLRQAFHSLNQRDISSPTINVEIGEFFGSPWIKVQHNGTALCPAAQQDIFQPYYALAANPESCPAEQRLSYSYFIITEHHRGQMAVTSSAAAGTCFNIQLPAVN